MQPTGSGHKQLILARLQKTGTELRQLQQLLTLEGIDLRVLLDFREAVDNVRHTAWAVQQWLETRDQIADASSVLSVLTAHRMRIATQLNRDLTLSLEAGEFTADTKGAEQLMRSAADLSQRLSAAGKSPGPPAH